MRHRHPVAIGATAFATILALTVVALQARTERITTPKEQFGFNLGDDYQLANYKQLTEYWKKLDAESERMTLHEIGKTAEGRPHLMAIVTAPENHKKLARYKEISRKLALAEGLTDAAAKALAAEGKAVVWIDGGLHATEVLGAQQLMETVYQMVSRNDEETQRFLRDVIILFVHANPDGHDLVADWYMRDADPKKRTTVSTIPRLYQKYVGHDNNRDSYMSTQAETTNMNRILYHEWFPQIMYNHHQTGPTGTVLFAPPFRDPFNYVFDPLIPLGIDLVGASMHNRFAAEGKPGATMRRGANYSTWWNGGLRTTVYYHNMIGLLTETIGTPWPMEIPFVPSRNLASGDLPFPIAPQTWHFRQSIEYSLTANRAVLDVAARHREQFLYNIYLMGKRAIEKGNTDTWTMYPSRVQKVQEAVARERADRSEGAPPVMSVGGFTTPAPAKFYELLKDKSQRDPRGYVLPADQRDFPTAIKFANTLIKAGVTVHRATAGFEVAGRKYPAGSIVVKTAQAFRAHVLDMFEPQDHPNDFAYPGGPPIPPYDSAGWTLAYQMGVSVDRILDGFDGPFEKVSGFISPSATIAGPASPVGYLLSPAQNDTFIIVNRLLKNGDEVFRLVKGGAELEGPGTVYVAARPQNAEIVANGAKELGIRVTAVASRPTGEMIKLKPVRIALWDRFGGSMPSGWTRWIFEQYEFPFEVVYPSTIDAGNLAAKYDVLVFVDGAIPSLGPPTGRRALFPQPAIDPQTIPEPYRGWMGAITADKSIPQIKAFLEAGGTVVTIGSSTNLAYHLKLPIANALVERTATGERPVPQDRFYVPGSVLQVAVNPQHPVAWGLESRANVFFDNSPVFKLQPDAALKGVTAIAWFDSPAPLKSGWAWGEHYLNGTVAIADARVGKGKLLLFGPEIAFRAQPHGTFKLLFNGIYSGSVAGEATSANPSPTSAH